MTPAVPPLCWLELGGSDVAGDLLLEAEQEQSIVELGTLSSRVEWKLTPKILPR